MTTKQSLLAYIQTYIQKAASCNSIFHSQRAVQPTTNPSSTPAQLFPVFLFFQHIPLSEGYHLLIIFSDHWFLKMNY